MLQQRRTPQSAVAWILFIILVPYLGIPIFLMLGFRKQGTRFPPIRYTGLPAGTRTTEHPLAETFARLGVPSATGGNALDLHETPEAALTALESVIGSAAESIDLQVYILAPDASGQRLVRLLTERALAGVVVRMNLDRLGTLSRPRAALRAFEAAGGQLRFFSPLIHPPDNGHMNLRNHRKLVIADNRSVWAGGRNFGDEYLAPPGDRWLDLSYTVSGPVVQGFIDVFASDWDVSGQAASAVPVRIDGNEGAAALQLVPAGPDEPGDALHDGLVNAIHRARERVWVASPYLVPTEALGQALSIAARRGVEVRLYVPEVSNQWSADLARGAYMRELARAGCRIFRYPGGMMHAKTGVIDDAAWAGSANFDVRSMLLNFEITLFAYDPASVSAIAGWHERLAARSVEGVKRVGWARRVLEGVFRLGAPVL